MRRREVVLVSLLASCQAPVSARNDELTNPYAGNSSAAKAGEALFGSMNCDGCHGAGGLGFGFLRHRCSFSCPAAVTARDRIQTHLQRRRRLQVPALR
jgi:hypothetical protein